MLDILPAPVAASDVLIAATSAALPGGRPLAGAFPAAVGPPIGVAVNGGRVPPWPGYSRTGGRPGPNGKKTINKMQPNERKLSAVHDRGFVKTLPRTIGGRRY